MHYAASGSTAVTSLIVEQEEPDHQRVHRRAPGAQCADQEELGVDQVEHHEQPDRRPAQARQGQRTGRLGPIGQQQGQLRTEPHDAEDRDRNAGHDRLRARRDLLAVDRPTGGASERHGVGKVVRRRQVDGHAESNGGERERPQPLLGHWLGALVGVAVGVVGANAVTPGWVQTSAG